MATDVVMPQMGESIAEGTIVRWIKKVGDKVDRDEPLFEISTDKVDAEIPSPAAGVVSEIRVKEGETVPINSVVAVIGQAGEAVAAPAVSTPQAPPPPAGPKPVPQTGPTPIPTPAAHKPAPALPTPHPLTHPTPVAQASPAPTPMEDAIRRRSSPLVRKIAKEHNVEIAELQGSGLAGRVTKADILGYLESGARPVRPVAVPSAPTGPAPAFRPAGGDKTQRMTVMRKKIAEHMILSRRTSAHVPSVFEVNFGRIAQIREAKKAEYERAGTKLTYLSFIVKAAVDSLRAMPVVNASVEGDAIVYHKEVNVGIAV